MKLDTNTSTFQHAEQAKSTPIVRSKAGTQTASFTQANNIQNLNEIIIVDDYFKIFEKNLSEVAIKNLISARLQPGYQLPQIHNSKALEHKTQELLEFSLAI